MYVSPEIVEVGRAQNLTLGTFGPHADKCDCAQPAEEPPVGTGPGS